MNENELERSLREWHRARVEADERAPMALRASLVAIPQVAPAPLRLFDRPGFILLVAALLAALFVGGAIAVGSGLIRFPLLINVPSPSPTAIETPVDANVIPLANAPTDSDLDAGTYAIGSPFPVHFDVTLGPGWRLSTFDEGDVSLYGTFGEGGHPALLQFYTVGRLIDDPCHPRATTPPGTPPTASEAVAGLEGLANLPGFVVRGPWQTTIGGRPATRLELAISTEIEAAGCARQAPLPLFETPTGEQPNMNGRIDPVNWDLVIWIVDAKPRPTVVVSNLHPEGLSARSYNEFVTDLVNSVSFD